MIFDEEGVFDPIDAQWMIDQARLAFEEAGLKLEKKEDNEDE